MIGGKAGRSCGKGLYEVFNNQWHCYSGCRSVRVLAHIQCTHAHTHTRTHTHTHTYTHTHTHTHTQEGCYSPTSTFLLCSVFVTITIVVTARCKPSTQPSGPPQGMPVPGLVHVLLALLGNLPLCLKLGPGLSALQDPDQRDMRCLVRKFEISYCNFDAALSFFKLFVFPVLISFISSFACAYMCT